MASVEMPKAMTMAHLVVDLKLGVAKILRKDRRPKFANGKVIAAVELIDDETVRLYLR